MILNKKWQIALNIRKSLDSVLFRDLNATFGVNAILLARDLRYYATISSKEILLIYWLRMPSISVCVGAIAKLVRIK